MKAIQEVNSGTLFVQETEMRGNDKKITEQKRKLDNLSMVLEKNTHSKSSHLKSHHQQHDNTTQHYSYQGHYSNIFLFWRYPQQLSYYDETKQRISSWE